MSQEWVELKHQDGQFQDPELNFGLSRDEKKPLPARIPPGSRTAKCLNAGGLVRCDPPEEAQQEACQPEPDVTETTPEAAMPVMPGLADSAGAGIGETTEGEVAAADAVAEPSPAPTKPKAKRTPRPKKTP